MSNNTIERFDIEMVLNSSNFTKKLQQFERQAMAASKRVEKYMENAFNLRGRGALKLQNEFNRAVQASARAGRQINQNLQFTGANQAVNQWGANIERQAERARQAIGRANRGMTTRLGGGSGGSRTNSQGLSQEQRRAAAFERATNRAADRVHAQQYGDVMSRLQRGGHREQASQFRQQMFGHYQQFRQSGDMQQFSRGMRESIRTQRNFLAAQSNASRGVGIAADGLIGKLGALGTAAVSLQKVWQTIVESVQVGVARQQAENRLSTSFGKDANGVNKQVSAIANEYGIDQTSALGQVSTLRATLPREDVSNSQIIDLMKNESVAKTSYGLTEDAIDRLNVGISQMMSSGKDAKVNAQDLNQIRNSFTEYLSILRTGTGNNKLTRKDVLSMTSEQFFKAFTEGLQKVNQQTGAYEKAREAFATKQIQMENSRKNWLNGMFKGESDGFSSLFGSISGFYKQTSGGAQTLGKVFGWLAERIGDLVNVATTVYIRARGYFREFEMLVDEAFSALPKPVQDAAKKIGEVAGGMGNDLVDVAIGLGAVATAAGSLKTVLGLLGMLKKDAGAGAAGASAGSGLITWGFQLYALYELAAHADQLNKAAVDSANWLRGKMGLDPVKQRTHEEIMNDPNTSTFGRIMEFDPTKDMHRVKKFFSDSPIFNGNWTGATAPGNYPASANYQPKVPLVNPAQKFDGQMTVNIKLNDQEIARIAKSVTQNFHESRTFSADLMSQPWGNHQTSPVPFRAPVQQ